MITAFRVISSAAAQPAAPVSKDRDAAKLSVIPEDSSKWRRDPFTGRHAKDDKASSGAVPASFTAAAAINRSPELNLQGIIQSGNAFHALINGHVLKTGDRLAGLTIRQISRYQVVLFNENKETFIYDIYQGRIDRGKQ
ncbi:MAG: hypothetical protein HY888_02810 [Deltaproteobacteria bacterium]|nr:hypothetical protein [Deltaproteobacteria bacterium]